MFRKLIGVIAALGISISVANAQHYVGPLQAQNNLSELAPNAAAARANIGAAPTANPTFTGTVNLPSGTSLASPVFTGTVTMPPGVSLTSPALTGTPTAPTGTAGSSTTQVATQAYANTAAASAASTAIPAATGQLLGGSGTAGAAAAVTLGSTLSLSGGTANINLGNSNTWSAAQSFGNIAATGTVSGAGFSNFVTANAPTAAWSGSGFGFTSAPTTAQVASGIGPTLAGTGLSNASGVLSVLYGTTAGHAVQGSAIGAASGVAGLDSGGNLQAPTTSIRGGIEAATAPTNQFQNGVSTAGVPLFAQPSFGNLSGTIASSQLPAATTSALGAVQIGTGLGVSAGNVSVTYGTGTGQAVQGSTIGTAGASLCLLSTGCTWTGPQTYTGISVTAATVHNEVQSTTGQMAASSTTLYDPSASFTSAIVGQSIVVDGAGASGADLTTTISSVTDGQHLVLAAPAQTTVPWWGAGMAFYVSKSATASYAIGDVLSLTGGTETSQATYTVGSLQVDSATVAAGGSGGAASGTCTFQGTTGVTRTAWGVGNPATSYFEGTGTMSSGAITGPITITENGDYSTPPTTETAEPIVAVSGCGSLTGATLSVIMAPNWLSPTTEGHYTTLPATVNTTPIATTGGTGAGATVTLWKGGSAQALPLGDQFGGYYAYGTDDTSAINTAIASVENQGGGTVILPQGRSLVLGELVLPYTGTAPPIMAPLAMKGAGNIGIQTISGAYKSLYSAGITGTILDMRYAGGSYLAKIDTRGQGTLRLEDMTFEDWGTDNFLFFKTTNTTPLIRDTTWIGNPACFEMTCQQDAMQFGTITGATTPLSTNGATAGFQGYSGHVDKNVFGYMNEIFQLGSAANGNYFVANEADDSTGSNSVTSGAIHLYGNGFGTSQNFFEDNVWELKGYPYLTVSTHQTGCSKACDNVYNYFHDLLQDGSESTANGQGDPTIGGYYFDGSSSFGTVTGAPESDISQNWVTDIAGTNTVIRPDFLQDINAGGYDTILGKIGIGTSRPTWLLDVQSPTLSTARLEGPTKGTQGQGTVLRFTDGTSECLQLGNESSFAGNTSTNMMLNTGCFNLDIGSDDVSDARFSFQATSFDYPITLNGSSYSWAAGKSASLLFGGTNQQSSIVATFNSTPSNGVPGLAITAFNGLSLNGGPITVAGHVVSSGTAPTTSNGTLDATATDTKGTLTEGTASTGAVITFNTAYTAVPDCVVTSPTGSAFTSYTPATGTLTIVNASATGDKFTYHCMQ